MPRFLPVPWIRWQRYKIEGVVQQQESGEPIAGLCVRAFDKDVVNDDFLGESETDAEGRFQIHFTDADFKDVVESEPDLYLCVFESGRDEPVVDTSCDIRENAGRDEYFEIKIPAATLEGPKSGA